MDFNFLITHPDMRLSDYRVNRKWVMDKEPYEILKDRNTTIYDILVKCGIFRSKNQARKMWHRGQLKTGLNDFKDVGKLRHRIFVHRVPDDFVHTEDI